MANKRTVHDCDVKLEELHRKLVRIVSQIDQYRKLRKRIATGKVKSPHPLMQEPGVKVMIAKARHPDLEDDIPFLGYGSGTGGGSC